MTVLKNAPKGKNEMPQKLPPNLKMGQNERNGANVENDTRESLIPDSPHSPQMEQILNKWGKIARGRITANGENKMGQTGKKCGKS